MANDELRNGSNAGICLQQKATNGHRYWQNRLSLRYKYSFISVALGNSIVAQHYLGLYNYDHMAYKLDTDGSEPSLAEMTKSAIELLSKSPEGYFLLVEGS